MRVEIRVIDNFYDLSVTSNKEGVIARSAGVVQKANFIWLLKEFIASLEEKRIWPNNS